MSKAKEHLSGDVRRGSAGGIDLPYPTTESQRLDKDHVGRLRGEVLPDTEARPPRRLSEAVDQFSRVASEHDHIPDWEKVGEMPDHELGRLLPSSTPLIRGSLEVHQPASSHRAARPELER